MLKREIQRAESESSRNKAIIADYKQVWYKKHFAILSTSQNSAFKSFDIRNVCLCLC